MMIKLLSIVFLLASYFPKAAFAGSLSVYKNDGTTVIGKNASCMIPPCTANLVGWGYADVSTGVVSFITDSSYVLQSSTFYYQNPDCTGSYFTFPGYVTGVVTDGVRYYSANGTAYGGACHGGGARTNGVCTNIGASCGWNYTGGADMGVTPPLCGSAIGPCKIK